MSKKDELQRYLQSAEKTASDAEMYEGAMPGDDFFAGLQESGLALTLGRDFELSAVGVTFGALDETQWKEFYQVIKHFRRGLKWILADWAWYGNNELKWSYEDMHALSGYKADSLKEYAYVAGNVPKSMRIDLLTFYHHKQVAHLPPDEQQYWLNEAVQKGLSGRQLAALIANSPTPTNGDPLGVADFKRQTRTIQQVVERVGRVKTIESEKERDETLERIARVQEWLDAARALIERVEVGE